MYFVYRGTSSVSFIPIQTPNIISLCFGFSYVFKLFALFELLMTLSNILLLFWKASKNILNSQTST